MKVLIGVNKIGYITSVTSLKCPNEVVGKELKHLASINRSIYVEEGHFKIGAYFPYYNVPTEKEIKELTNFYNMM
jgi:hypothetical protein